MRTIGGEIDATQGLGAGFDFLRVALAFGVVAWHEPRVLTPANAHLHDAPLIWLMGYSILPMFFGLSGFLISGSAQRLGLGNFLINRGLRIFPALIVEIALSAFVLGPLFTSLPLGEYWTSLQTYRYFTNVLGLINYSLPGVFAHNPTSLVNWSLWTVPYELGCYALMSAAILSGALKRPASVIAVAFAWVALGELALVLDSSGYPMLLHFAGDVLLGRGASLLVSFLLGIGLYLLRHRVAYDIRLFAVACAVLVGVALLRDRLPESAGLAVACPCLVYAMAFIGVTRISPLPLFRRGDYSYGVYLYGVPIAQAIRAAVPGAENPLLHFSLTVVLLTLFAMFSWTFIERPVLAMRKRFSFVARARGVEGPGESRVGAPPPVPGAMP